MTSRMVCVYIIRLVRVLLNGSHLPGRLRFSGRWMADAANGRFCEIITCFNGNDSTMKAIKKLGLMLLPLVLILACMIYGSGLYAQPENIEFGGENTRGPVDFPHELHFDVADCSDCHHMVEDGEVVPNEDPEEGEDSQCGTCHNDDAKIKKREAFHYQCIRCHDKFRMTKEPTGPTLCGECHVLKKD